MYKLNGKEIEKLLDKQTIVHSEVVNLYSDDFNADAAYRLEERLRREADANTAQVVDYNRFRMLSLIMGV